MGWFSVYVKLKVNALLDNKIFAVHGQNKCKLPI